MPSFTLDTDQLSVQKVGFSSNLTYGSNFNLNLFLVQSGIAYSANALDQVTIVLYKAGQTISGGAVQNLAIIGAPTLKTLSGSGIAYLQVNVSLLTAQLAALVQTPGNTVACMMHVTYTQADGESYPTSPDSAFTIYPNLTLSTAGTANQAPAGYPNPASINVFNPILNGDFSVDQRLATKTGLTGAANLYVMDKWKLQASAGLTAIATVTLDQQTAVGNMPWVTPDWTGTSSFKIAVTTAQSAPAAGDFLTLSQYIENSLFTPLLNGPISVSFLAKANLAATIGVFILDSVLTYNYVIPIALIGDGNWHYYTATFLTPPATLANWNINAAGNLWGAKFGFCFICGTTYTGTPNQWNTTGGYLAGTGQGNFMATIANYVQLTQVALSPGLFAQPWGQLPPAINYQLCQRYYAKSYSQGDAPGANPKLSGPMAIMTGLAAGTSAWGGIDYPSPMRATGTPVVYGPYSGTVNKVWTCGSASTEITVTGAAQLNEKGFDEITAASGLAAVPYGAHWVNDVDYAGTTGGN